MLQPDHFIDAAGIHPFKLFQAVGIAAGKYPVKQAAGTILTQCTDQHFAYIIVRTDTEAGFLFHRGDKTAEDVLYFLTSHIIQRGHRLTHFPHFFRAHVLENFRRIGFPD
eukprot:GFYU01078578.1.p2 GENE.GFYU01078578.1~~GFYU01078578.1.p2  ORF type:complete len:110 (-),score=8.60 GFYU01078578.1:29-358(-)